MVQLQVSSTRLSTIIIYELSEQYVAIVDKGPSIHKAIDTYSDKVRLTEAQSNLGRRLSKFQWTLYGSLLTRLLLAVQQLLITPTKCS